MFQAIAKKEILNSLTSFRFLVCTLMLLLLASLGTWIGGQDYQRRLRDHHLQLAEQEDQLQHLHTYSYLQPIALRPPPPLSILARGTERRLGHEVRVQVFAVPERTRDAQRGNEYLRSLFELDLTTVVGMVLGLLALLLTCDAIVGERQHGTLRLVFTNSLTRSTFLWGKFSGLLLTLLLPLAGALVASVLIAARADVLRFDVAQGIRLLALFAIYVAYLSLMLLLGLGISLLAPSASTALVGSVLAWLIIVLLVPLAAPGLDAPRSVNSDPDLLRAAQRLERERDEKLQQLWRDDPMLAIPSGHTSAVLEAGRHRAILYRYGSAAYYEALRRYYSEEVELGRRYAAELFALHRQATDRVSPTRRLARWLLSLSPAVLLHRLSASVVNTSRHDHERFLGEARRYRLALITYLEDHRAFDSPRWFTDDSLEAPSPWTRLFGLEPEEVPPDGLRELFARLQEPTVAEHLRSDLARLDADPSRYLRLGDLPRFTYRERMLAEAWRKSSGELFGLVLANLLLGLLVQRRFAEYRLS